MLSGGGKLSLFAIGNYYKQTLLAPVHEYFSDLLRTIPMDGTFDQLKPLNRLAGLPGTVYSFDLKAATDRWPLGALGMLVDAMFDNTHASCIVCTLLGLNVFDMVEK